ncbi:hypothetical protein DPSP01_014171 [Paraphaeosphaeria sporulosa]
MSESPLHHPPPEPVTAPDVEPSGFAARTRSVLSVDPTPSLTQRGQTDHSHQYSQPHDGRIQAEARPRSQGSTASQTSQPSQRAPPHQQAAPRQTSTNREPGSVSRNETTRKTPVALPTQLLSDFSSSYSESVHGNMSRSPSLQPDQPRSGWDGDTLQRCEDEPIHIPGAVQGFGLLIALQEDPGESGSLPVRIVSENVEWILGRSPRELFALESFTDLLSEEQADNLLDHIDFIKDEDTDVQTNGPEVFTLFIKMPNARRSRKFWCAIHVNDINPDLIICEFELEDDDAYPLVPSNEMTPKVPEDTLQSHLTAEEHQKSIETGSWPLRVLRSSPKRKGEAVAIEVLNIMSQVQEHLAAAPNLEKFLEVLVGLVKELTGFHRVMIYQFDENFNGRVVSELGDPRATKDLYKGLTFPASDIPKQARELYKINKVRMLYDRDLETARLVCRSAEDLENPLDLTHSYLRATSPIHLKYLANMAVRSSMSISISAFGELWGLITCHFYGPRGMRASFPIRKMCRLVGDSASRNIERLSYASRLQARKLINTVPTQHNPCGYIIASSDDLLKLFDADFGLLSIRDETKTLGQVESSQEALALLEYLRMREISSVLTSTDIIRDFPDFRYPPGLQIIAGMLVVPISVGGSDFIVFFRKSQLKEVKWAGNPYENIIKEGTEGYFEPRKSFKTWSEIVVGTSREWTGEEVETAAVLCLVYGKFIEIWRRQEEAALQSSQLTRLLLANYAHEVRTPLNAIINYLEIALEGSLNQEARENLARSHSASKSLIYAINDLLDLTKTKEGGPLLKDESFNLRATLIEATNMFVEEAKRRNISYDVVEHPGLPQQCIGDQRRVRQAISNITANAIQNTIQGGVKVEMYVAARPSKTQVDVGVAVTDSGVGMSAKQLDQLFHDLKKVQSEPAALLEDALDRSTEQLMKQNEKTTLGLGLAVVACIIKKMEGQLRLKSEEGKGSRSVVQFPFDLPDSEPQGPAAAERQEGNITPLAGISSTVSEAGERTLIAPDFSRNDSAGGEAVARKPSVKSMNSAKSLRSFKSASSNRSERSDVDRLLEAIQKPHMVGRQPTG